jgi:hypothetical protein
MLPRLIALLLLAAATLAAAAAAPAGAPPLPTPDPADWKALACGALVALYMAWRRSRWSAG